jgi:hypothetical protein
MGFLAGHRSLKLGHVTQEVPKSVGVVEDDVYMDSAIGNAAVFRIGPTTAHEKQCAPFELTAEVCMASHVDNVINKYQNNSKVCSRPRETDRSQP